MFVCVFGHSSVLDLYTYIYSVYMLGDINTKRVRTQEQVTKQGREAVVCHTAHIHALTLW